MPDAFRSDESEALMQCYQMMLAKRDEMLSGLSVEEQGEARRELMVDSLILGVLHHLHEAASDNELFARRITFDGHGSFTQYANNLAQEFITVVSQLQQQNLRLPSIRRRSAE